jgi:hypothetical protein
VKALPRYPSPHDFPMMKRRARSIGGLFPAVKPSSMRVVIASPAPIHFLRRNRCYLHCPRAARFLRLPVAIALAMLACTRIRAIHVELAAQFPSRDSQLRIDSAAWRVRRHHTIPSKWARVHRRVNSLWVSA